MFSLIAITLVAAQDLAVGQSLRRSGKLDEALRFFEAAAAAGENLDARRELGHTLALAGRYPEALDAYRRLEASADAVVQIDAARYRGFTLLYLGDVPGALEAFKREGETATRASVKARAVHAAWYRGHVLTEVGEFGRANEAFLEALSIDPEDVNTLHLMGVLAARQGDRGSLRYQIEDLRALVERSPESLREGQVRRVKHLEAERDLLSGKPRSAMALAAEANRLFPHPLYRETLARAQAADSKIALAISTYREILSATDERSDIPIHYVKALFALGKALESQGKKKEAAESYLRFLAHWRLRSLPGVAEAEERLSALRAGS